MNHLDDSGHDRFTLLALTSLLFSSSNCHKQLKMFLDAAASFSSGNFDFGTSLKRTEIAKYKTNQAENNFSNFWQIFHILVIIFSCKLYCISVKEFRSSIRVKANLQKIWHSTIRAQGAPFLTTL